MTHPWAHEPERRWWQSPVIWALALSAGIHVLATVGWLATVVLVQAHPEWFPRWLQKAVLPPSQAAATPPPLEMAEYRSRPDEYEIPLSFIEVDPALVVADSPKNPQFQSTANTLAQNIAAPNPQLNQPFVGGTQEKYAKTFETERAQPKSEPKPDEPPDVELADVDRTKQESKPAQLQQVAVLPQPAATPPKGEVLQLALAPTGPPQPVEKRPVAPRPPAEAQPPQEPQRPSRRQAKKSLAEVRQTKGILVGEPMKQDGGVDRRGIPAFNVTRGPMGEYGRRMWEAVQQKWYSILDERRFAGEHIGKVVVTFRLAPDGTVMDVKAIEDSAGEAIFCETAIMVAASFGNWSNEMRSTYGPKPLDCTCVFWY